MGWLANGIITKIAHRIFFSLFSFNFNFFFEYETILRSSLLAIQIQIQAVCLAFLGRKFEGNPYVASLHRLTQDVQHTT